MMKKSVLLVALGAISPATARTFTFEPRRVRPVLALRGGAVEQPKTGLVWQASTFTRDHVRFMVEALHYLGAYVGPRALSPKTIENIMCTVNSINTCPYCTGLHGQLARMADAEEIDSKAAEVIYAKTFAEETGRGAKVGAAFERLSDQIGVGKALSVRALCWALLWGKTTGNSINAVRGKLASFKWLSISPFELVMFLFYGPLFLVIGVLNKMLTFAPKVPGWFSAVFGAVLWVPQALHFLIAGTISLALRLIAAPMVGLSL